MRKFMNPCIILWLLLSVSADMTVHAAECSYRQKGSPLDSGPSVQGKCGEPVGEDGFRIYPEHLKRLAFKDGLAEVYVDGRVFYVARSGKAVRAYLFDNGADYFSGGLARTVKGGKIGFIDRRLNVKIRPQFDFAFPFKNGVAAVCNGCREVPEGDHHSVSGGKWGVINRRGKIVVPIQYGREELDSIHP